MALVAAAAILDSLEAPTRLLGARRTSPSELAGLWEFPGGKVELGELPVAALRRELREELGIEVIVGDELAPGAATGRPREEGVSWPAMNGHRMRVWLAAVERGSPRPLADHDELRWLDLADLESVPWLPADLPILGQLRASTAH